MASEQPNITEALAQIAAETARSAVWAMARANIVMQGSAGLSALYYLSCLGHSITFIAIYIGCTTIHNTHLWVP